MVAQCPEFREENGGFQGIQVFNPEFEDGQQLFLGRMSGDLPAAFKFFQVMIDDVFQQIP